MSRLRRGMETRRSPLGTVAQQEGTKEVIAKIKQATKAGPAGMPVGRWYFELHRNDGGGIFARGTTAHEDEVAVETELEELGIR